MKNDHTETEVRSLYRELLSLSGEKRELRESLNDADVRNMHKIRVITQAIDALHQLIARHRPSLEVACALDQVIADLEDSIK